MEKLPEDLQVMLFARFELEELVNLRNTCRSFHKTLTKLDDSLVKKKVLQRVPWFTLNDTDVGNDTWHKCALVTTKRSAEALVKGFSFKWKLFSDLQVAMESPEDMSLLKPLDITNLNDAKEKVLTKHSPIFRGSEFPLPSGNVVDGFSVKSPGIELNLKTLETCRSGFAKPNHKKYPAPASKRQFSVVSPSGLVIKSVDSTQRLTCIAENDQLLHVRMQNTFQGDGDCDECVWDESDLEWLIHKPSCKRDERGTLLIDDSRAVEFLPQSDDGMTFLKLLPGSSGALVLKYLDTGHSYSYLGYVEPTRQMRHIVICYLPPVRPAHYYKYWDVIVDNFVSYNGYFYLYFEGRFVQLWVDLGKQRLLEWASRYYLYGHSDLPQKVDTQSLTACRASFPTMGTIMTTLPTHDRHAIVRGLKEHKMDRYVTIDRRFGQGVVDLLTGKMYLCEIEHEKDLIVPMLNDKKEVSFASLSEMVFGRVEKRLAQLHKKNQYVNIGSSYAQWASIYIPLQDSKRKTTIEVPFSDLYESVTVADHMFVMAADYTSLEEIIHKVSRFGARPTPCVCGKCKQPAPQPVSDDHYYSDLVVDGDLEKDLVNVDKDDEDEDDYEDDYYSEDDDSEYDSDDLIVARDPNYNPPPTTLADIRREFEELEDHPDDDKMYEDDTNADFEQLREAFASMLLKPQDERSAMKMFAVGVNDGYTKRKPLPRRQGKMFGPYMDGYAYGVDKLTNEIAEQVVKETEDAGGLERFVEMARKKFGMW